MAIAEQLHGIAADRDARQLARRIGLHLRLRQRIVHLVRRDARRRSTPRPLLQQQLHGLDAGIGMQVRGSGAPSSTFESAASVMPW